MSGAEISVVIGYKDWGLRRLVGAVRSLRSSLSSARAEIIVSDYGSIEHEGYRRAIEDEGAVYVRTDTDGVWSRSRALNAGLQVATGEILVATDADMVFSPATFPAVLEAFRADPDQYVIMQCNDLPEGIDHGQIEAGVHSWEELNRISRLRPRWGMGGMIAVPRSAYLASRGLDERMEIYGGEDIDFARRMRRLGLKLHWLEDRDAQMYHVWHPSSRDSAELTPSGSRAIARNRDIQLNDRTAARNLAQWEFAPATREPLVSVVISTFNRAQHLRYAILSTLAQSFRDFELIVIDDGSTDDTESVVAEFSDPRIRFYRRENGGLAAARNFATTVARGRFVAVMDDDDIMLPKRLEHSLNAVTDGANGSYGGWIDFEDATGARHFRVGKALSLESLLFNNSTYLHPTLLIERRWMQAVPYDETLRSGSDFNLAVRMARSGARLQHSGQYVLLRRNHSDQITHTDPVIQKSAGAITAFWGRAGMTDAEVALAREDRAKKDKVPTAAQRHTEPMVLEYLPDHAVQRRARVRALGAVAESAAQILARAELEARLQTDTGMTIFEDYLLAEVTLDDVLRLRAEANLEVAVETQVLEPTARMTIADPLQLEALEPDPFSPPYVRLLATWAEGAGVLVPGDAFMLVAGADAEAVRHAGGRQSDANFTWKRADLELTVAMTRIESTEAELQGLAANGAPTSGVSIALVTDWGR